MKIRKDLTGQRFGKWTVESYTDLLSDRGRVYWNCVCDCGSKKAVLGFNLAQGRSHSCHSCAHKTGKGSHARWKKRKPEGHAARTSAKCQYIRSARDRGIKFALSDDLVFQLMEGNCTYCGSGPVSESHPSSNGVFKFNGIDRVDNSRGYVPDNVVTCCMFCNLAKRDRSVSDFLTWARKVAAHTAATHAHTTSRHQEVPSASSETPASR
jgi:5-methylcytosine-specific restriction endonuclease McrA